MVRTFISMAGGVLVAVPLVLLAAQLPVEQPRAGPLPTATGTIEGVVEVPTRPARRVEQRYPTRTPDGPREQRPVPSVAHLEGPVEAPAAGDVSLEIIQRDSIFQPSLVVVPVGGTVAFPNDDPFFHNVFSYSRAARFDLGRYPEGESKDVTLTEPGYVKVFCEIHDWMRAAVLVVENPFYARVEEDGRFTLTGVPAGTHTLRVTHFDEGSRAVEVEVPPGGTIEVQVDLGG